MLSVLKIKTQNHFYRDCPKYDDVLPKGMCIKYLKNQRIDQTADQMLIANDAVYGLYQLLRVFLKILFSNGTPKISFIKEWLGRLFLDMFPLNKSSPQIE